LLQVLEHGIFRRVGGVEEIKVDVRIISATNRDLSADVKEGRFRADLYHRLSVHTLHIPPLRERKEDIPVLANYFLKTKMKDRDKSFTITDDAMKALLQYHWPGNVRELNNLVERMLVLCDNGEITTNDLPRNVLVRPVIDSPQIDYSKANVLTLTQVEEQYIKQVIKVSKNKTHAAELLGISLPTLRKKLRDYQIEN
jgi:DNA-binding NtrC family response regulator